MQELSLKLIEEQVASLKDAFLEVQQPRTDFELKHFVLGAHDTEPRQYAQCVVELQIKYDAIRRAQLNRERLLIEIKELRNKKKEISEIDAKLKEIDIEEQDRAMLGALREFNALFILWKSFKKKYTRQEMNDDAIIYWQKRLARQAALDESATGRVLQGNLDALRQIGNGIHPQLSHVTEIEQRFLNQSNPDQKIFIAMPSIEKLKDVPEQFQIDTPSGWQIKFYNVFGRSIDDAFHDIVHNALADGATLILTIEDDTFPEKDTLTRLLNHWKEGKRIVGAWYPKRQKSREGTPIVVKNGLRQHLEDDGNVHEVLTIPFGCTLFETSVFREITQPWFVSTSILTQDTFFCQKARDVGIKIYCDTSIRCKHIDRDTKIIYE